MAETLQQTQTLSLRISEVLRKRLEDIRKLTALRKGESVSTSEIAKQLLESAREDRFEVVELLNRPSEALLEIRRKGEAGLDYFGARYMSGAQGRFTSADWSAKPQPVPYASLGDPQTLDLYAYVRNSPLKNRDPDGHDCIFGIGNTCVPPPPPPPPPQAPLLNSNGSMAQGPQLPPAPTASGPKATLGIGFGLTGGGTAAVGLGVVGVGATGSGTAAVFANAQSGTSVSAGLSASGGAMATAGQAAVGRPEQPSSSTALGAFAGVGGGIVLTTAGTNQTLATTKSTFSFDVGLVFGGSIQVSAGDKGVNAVSITIGPAIGLAFTKVDTSTVATGNQ